MWENYDLLADRSLFSLNKGVVLNCVISGMYIHLSCIQKEGNREKGVSVSTFFHFHYQCPCFLHKLFILGIIEKLKIISSVLLKKPLSLV